VFYRFELIYHFIMQIKAIEQKGFKHPILLRKVLLVSLTLGCILKYANKKIHLSWSR